jgi:CxxC-x17-CxxC domain-containing protein
MPYPRDNRTGGNSSKRYGKRSFGGDFGGKPTMHQAVCSDCNQDCEVPFKPSGDRPVLCKNCFKGKGGDTSPREFGKRSFQKAPYGGKRESGSGVTREQFEILDAKLNKIIDMLESAE